MKNIINLGVFLIITLFIISGCETRSINTDNKISKVSEAKTEIKPEERLSKDNFDEKKTDNSEKFTENRDNELNMEDKFLVCIDPGHGDNSFDIMEAVAPGTEEFKPGFAFGTQGVATGITERDLNMNISYKVKTKLSELGIDNVLTREGRESDLTNINRAEFANKLNADLVVRIHANGAETLDAKGAMVLIPSGKYIQDQNMLEQSKIAGTIILESFLFRTSAHSLGIIERDDMTGFNWSTVPVVLLEMGFMTNPEEDILLNSEEYQEKMVDGIVDGILNYKNSIGK